MFDEQNNFASLAVKMYQYFKQIDPEWNPQMGDISFGSRHDHIALQAADLLCYSWYQYTLKGSAASSDIHKVLRAQKLDELQFFTKSSMDKILEKAAPTKGKVFTAR